MATRVIFSIDNSFDLHTLAKFLRYLDTKRALGLMKDKVKVLQGSYKGLPETSFSLGEEDFNFFVKGSCFIKDQETLLFVYDCVGRFILQSNKEGKTEAHGMWVNIKSEDKGDSWTYDPEDKTWWACR